MLCAVLLAACLNSPSFQCPLLSVPSVLSLVLPVLSAPYLSPVVWLVCWFSPVICRLSAPLLIWLVSSVLSVCCPLPVLRPAHVSLPRFLLPRFLFFCFWFVKINVSLKEILPDCGWTSALGSRRPSSHVVRSQSTELSVFSWMLI